MTASEHKELLPALIRDLCGDEVNGGFIRDLCFTVWSKCHNPTHEDGNTDWGNDTLPTVQEGVKLVRKKLTALAHPLPDGAEPVPAINKLIKVAGVVYAKLCHESASVTIIDQIDLGDALEGLEPYLPLRRPFASPTGMGVTEERQVKPLDDAEIMAIIRECFPWKDHGRIYDALTYEKSPPLFPQATITKPNYLAERFVRAVEARVAAALHPTSETTEEPEKCFICAEPFKVGEMVLHDVNEGLGHRACFGEDREAYVKDIDTGEPLGPDDPIPEGWPYVPPASSERGR